MQSMIKCSLENSFLKLGLCIVSCDTLPLKFYCGTTDTDR